MPCSDEKLSEKGSFVYMNDSHTSVLGMRSLVADNKVPVTCLSFGEAYNIFDGESNSNGESLDSLSNSLFVYPAQCNFSGLKYPLEWIEKTHSGSLNKLLKRFVFIFYL